MFGKRNAEAAREIDSQRESTPHRGRPDTDETRVFQVGYGEISKIALRIMPDRVLRTLFLYEPRSGDENRFVRIRLPDGVLPDSNLLPDHRDGIVAQWAKEDTDAYLDLEPMLNALDPADRGEGRPMGRVVDEPARRFHSSAAPAARERRQPPPAEPAAQPQPTQQRPRKPQRAKSSAKRGKPQATQVWRGEVVDCGIGEFRDRSQRAFNSYFVRIADDRGVEENILGCDLDDKMRQLGADVGDYVVIRQVGRRGPKKLFEVHFEE